MRRAGGRPCPPRLGRGGGPRRGGRRRRLLRARRGRQALQLGGRRRLDRRRRRLPEDPPLGPRAALLRGGVGAGAGRRDARRQGRRVRLLRPQLPRGRAWARPRRRGHRRGADELASLSAARGGAPDRGRDGDGDRAPEPRVPRRVRPLWPRARRRVDGRERRLRRVGVDPRRAGRGLRSGASSSPTATSSAPATRPGTSGTTSSATGGPSSTGSATRRPSPDGQRASPRARPPRRCGD